MWRSVTSFMRAQMDYLLGDPDYEDDTEIDIDIWSIHDSDGSDDIDTWSIYDSGESDGDAYLAYGSDDGYSPNRECFAIHQMEEEHDEGPAGEAALGELTLVFLPPGAGSDPGRLNPTTAASESSTHDSHTSEFEPDGVTQKLASLDVRSTDGGREREQQCLEDGSESHMSMSPKSEDYYASEQLSSDNKDPPLIDHVRLERQLRARIGPRPTANLMKALALSYINVAIQIQGCAPLTSDELSGRVPVTYPFGLTNVASIIEQLVNMEREEEPPSGEFVGAIESFYDLLEEGDQAISAHESTDSAETDDDGRFPVSRECHMCEGRAHTPEGAVWSVDSDGNEVVPGVPLEEGGNGAPSHLDAAALEAQQGELDEVQQQIASKRARLAQAIGQRRPRGARGRAREARHRAAKNDQQPLVFGRAQQNIAAAAVLARRFPEAATLEVKQLQEELCILLDKAAVQQAESSA